MSPEQEIERIKRDFAEHWSLLEEIPGIQKAIADNDPIKLGEVAAAMVYGNRVSEERQLPAYALKTATQIIANGKQETWKSIFAANGIKHGDFRTGNREEDVKVLASAIQAYHRVQPYA